MKKIATFILLMCMVLTLVACTTPEGTTPEGTTPEGTTPEGTTPESTTPEITGQSLYDLSKVPALLEKHDNVLVQFAENGEVYQKDFYSKEYCYTFFDGEESDAAYLSTDHSFFYHDGDKYFQVITITPDGMADEANFFAQGLDTAFFTESISNDIIKSVTEKDGQIIVMSVSDQEEMDDWKAQGWIFGEDETVLDAKTGEVIYTNSTYTNNETGEVHKGAIYVTYNAEFPEEMNTLVEYAQQTEDMRTVTIVSNPGAENEKTDSVQVPRGIQIELFAASEEENPFTVYADEACTQVIELNADVNSDLTLYIKWNK